MTHETHPGRSFPGMDAKTKNLAITAGGALAGNYVYQRFIAKQADGSGFIEQKDGFGMDDIVHAFVITGTITLGHMLFKSS